MESISTKGRKSQRRQKKERIQVNSERAM